MVGSGCEILLSTAAAVGPYQYVFTARDQDLNLSFLLVLLRMRIALPRGIVGLISWPPMFSPTTTAYSIGSINCGTAFRSKFGPCGGHLP